MLYTTKWVRVFPLDWRVMFTLGSQFHILTKHAHNNNKSGGAFTWDVTAATTLADSYLLASSVTAAAAAASKAAASRKEDKYSDLMASFSLQPIAVQTLGPISESAVDFLRELGRRISSKFQEERQPAHLLQRFSVTLQRYNAVILHDSFPH